MNRNRYIVCMCMYIYIYIYKRQRLFSNKNCMVWFLYVCVCNYFRVYACICDKLFLKTQSIDMCTCMHVCIHTYTQSNMFFEGCELAFIYVLVSCIHNNSKYIALHACVCHEQFSGKAFFSNYIRS